MMLSTNANPSGGGTPKGSQKSCVDEAGHQNTPSDQQVQGLSRPPADANADRWFEYCGELVDSIGRYANMAAEAADLRDPKVLAYALRQMATRAVNGCETLPGLKAALASDEALRAACRPAAADERPNAASNDGSGRHG